MATNEYKDYLQSGVWGHLRDLVLGRAEGKCEVCGTEGTLHAHHTTYRRCWGNEKLEDLIVLCPFCHMRVHALAKERIGMYRRGLWVALMLLRKEVRDGARWQVR